MKIRTIIMMLTLVVAGLVIGCSSEPAAPTTTPVPVVRQIFPVEDIGQFLAQPNPKICEQCYLADADLAGAVEAAGMACVVTDTVMADPTVAAALAKTTLEAVR